MKSLYGLSFTYSELLIQRICDNYYVGFTYKEGSGLLDRNIEDWINTIKQFLPIFVPLQYGASVKNLQYKQ
jgi:hypothetical protein